MPYDGVVVVPSPKLKTKLAIRVASRSFDCDASADTVSGAPAGVTNRMTTGALSVTGMGGGLVGLLVGLLVGCAVAAGLRGASVEGRGLALEVSGNTGAPGAGVGDGVGSIDGGTLAELTSRAD